MRQVISQGVLSRYDWTARAKIVFAVKIKGTVLLKTDTYAEAKTLARGDGQVVAQLVSEWKEVL